MLVVGRILSELGDSDCETIDDGLLAQPINAASSFSYVVVGILIAISAWRTPTVRTEGLVYAVCVAAIGLGSVAFHGPQPTGSGVMHDLPILVTACFMLAADIGLIMRVHHRGWVFAGLVAVSTLVTLVSRAAAGALTGVVLLTVAGLEIVVRRRRLRAGDRRSEGWLYLFLVGVMLVAGATWILGRTDAPLCRPESLFQFHGLWHVLSAIAFGVWWLLARRGPAEEARSA